MKKRIRKAVFPVAGLGTRFIPATKANPKEMLPVVDKPLIQYAIDEARAAGADIVGAEDLFTDRTGIHPLTLDIGGRRFGEVFVFLTGLRLIGPATAGNGDAEGEVVLWLGARQQIHLQRERGVHSQQPTICSRNV